MAPGLVAGGWPHSSLKVLLAEAEPEGPALGGAAFRFWRWAEWGSVVRGEGGAVETAPQFEPGCGVRQDTSVPRGPQPSTVGMHFNEGRSK